MARSVEDLAIVLEQMAGFDEFDSTSLSYPTPSYYKELQQPIGALKIGLLVVFLKTI